MSKIVSPVPSRQLPMDPDPTACWWRFRTVPNADGYHYVVRTDATDKTDATWVSWEFFDGYDVVIDTGYDRPTRVRLTSHESPSYAMFFDVLHVGAPTPSPRWQQLTRPGEFTHPNGDAA